MSLDAMSRELLHLMAQMPRHSPAAFPSEAMRGELFLLLHLLEAGGAASPGEMSRAMQTSTARTAAALNAMARKGWVIRKADPGDLRRTIVCLTEAGRTHGEALQAQMLSALTQLLSALGEKDSGEYLRILRRIQALQAKAAPQDNIPTPIYNERIIDQK